MLGRHSALIIAVFVWISLIGQTENILAQDTIRYTAGPALQIPTQFSYASVDFDRDGEAEVDFTGSGFLCTADVPTSYCQLSFTGIPMSTNSLLCIGSQFVVMAAGTIIGDSPIEGMDWRSFTSATLAVQAFSPKYGTNGWNGPLSTNTEGYLGVRFHTSSGQHYGWVHVRMPKQDASLSEFSPVVLDWAYESQPDTPIKAGAMPVAPITLPQIVRPEQLRLNWLTEIGQVYQVQFKETLGAPGWSNLDITVIATSTNVVVDVPMKGNIGFFQAVRTE